MVDQSKTPPRRAEILSAAADLATAEGLEGLSIGVLAAEVGMSKSGLYAHFGSKQELQHAVVDHAAARFEPAVLAAGAAAAPGLPRLRALVEAWIRHVEHSDYRGGCFFDAASSEFASRPGPVRARLAGLSRVWIAALQEQAALAVRLGELAPETDPDRLTFQLHAYVTEANWWGRLFDEPDAFARARDAVADTLDAHRPNPRLQGDAS